MLAVNEQIYKVFFATDDLPGPPGSHCVAYSEPSYVTWRQKDKQTIHTIDHASASGTTQYKIVLLCEHWRIPLTRYYSRVGLLPGHAQEGDTSLVLSWGAGGGIPYSFKALWLWDRILPSPNIDDLTSDFTF